MTFSYQQSQGKGDRQRHNLNSRLATATLEPVLTQIQAHRRQSPALLDTMSLLTADDSQPKIHSKSSRSFSVTVSSKEMPSYKIKKQKEIIRSHLQTTGGGGEMDDDDGTGLYEIPSKAGVGGVLIKLLMHTRTPGYR